MRRLAHLALVLTAAGALLAACSRPSDLPDGSVSRTKVDFQAPAAGGNPTAETLYVSNSGRGTLEAPTVSVAYQDGADWLTVTVTSSGDRYVIALQPVTAALAAGTYRATLTLTWASGSAEPARVSVTLVVPARTTVPESGFQPSVEAVAIEAPRGGGEPAPATFQVLNAGRGTLPVPSIDVAYAGTAEGWLTTAVAAASDGYTVTAQAHVAGIPSGVHHATLTLRAAGAVVPPRTLPVTLTVPSPEVFLSSREIPMRAPAGGLDATATLGVSNTGGGQLAKPVATVVYEGGAASWDGMLDVVVSGTPGYYELELIAHQVRSTPAGSSKLPPGTYAATLQVSAPGAGVSDTARVTLEVPAPVMQLSASQVVFSEYASCPLPPSATVSVVNAGGGSLAAPVVAMEPGVEAWLATSVAATSRDAYAIVLAPTAFPPVQAGASVETTVMITDPASVASAMAVRVRFEVLPSDLSATKVTPSRLEIWAQRGLGDPAPRTITLETPAGCLPPPEAAVDDPTGNAGWISVSRSSSPHRHEVQVRASLAGLAAGERRTGTVHLSAAGMTWDVPVSLGAGDLAAAGPLVVAQPGVVTPLADGRAVMTGWGVVQLFDPATRTWTRLPDSKVFRMSHGAVQLEDGRLLLCGGNDRDNALLSSCEVMSGSEWTVMPTALSTARTDVTLVTMPRGRVLVLGGASSTPEILDVASGRSVPLTGVAGRSAVKRPDGSILVAGNGKSWLYSPAQDAWAPAGDMLDAQERAALLPLPDGRVLVDGGYVDGFWFKSGAQIWNPRTGAWSRENGSPSWHDAGDFALLSSGKVLAVSGTTMSLSGKPSGLGDLEVFDPVSERWSVAGTWAPTGTYAGLVRLSTGMVLFAPVVVHDPSTDTYPVVAETYTW